MGKGGLDKRRKRTQERESLLVLNGGKTGISCSLGGPTLLDIEIEGRSHPRMGKKRLQDN